jgi:hypothetical protein
MFLIPENIGCTLRHESGNTRGLIISKTCNPRRYGEGSGILGRPQRWQEEPSRDEGLRAGVQDVHVKGTQNLILAEVCQR